MKHRALLCFPNPKDLKDDPFNPLNQMIIQMACILVMSHFFHLLLKPLGQTGPIAQILAGIVLSPALLSRINKVEEFFIQTSSATYYAFFAFLFRTSFMFLIGLEIDSDFLRRNFKKSSIIACGGFTGCSLLGLTFVWLIILLLGIDKSGIWIFILVFLIILSNSASPVVFHSISDMKLDTSEIGRLAISSALITEMTCVVVYTITISLTSSIELNKVFLVIFLTVAQIIVNKYLVFKFGTGSPNEKYLSKSQVLIFFILILVLSTIIESHEINSALPLFLFGVLFPREGKAYRTLLQCLSYPVHEFIMPVYFGYIGFRLNITNLENKYHYIVLVLTVILSFGGKVIGVLGICYYQKIPRKQWFFLSCILSMKGHAALLVLDANTDMKAWWNTGVHNLFVAAIVITTLLSGMIASFLLRSQERHFSHDETTLEIHDTDKELRVLSCVYGPRHTRGAISLISALSGSKGSPFTPLLMHLVSLPKKRKSDLMYHEQEDGGGKLNDEDDFGMNEGLEINDSIDSFAKESKILIHQTKLVSPAFNMYEEVCSGAEDLRVSIIFLPFHKHQRIDGKTANDGEELRIRNHKILRHAPCSVGIFVDRNQTGFQQPHGSESVQHVATLFFGGPDDREALALSKWFTVHSQLHLTIIRFLATDLREENRIGKASLENHEVLMAIPGSETEDDRDNTFLDDFYNRYVTSGQVGYIEKHVNNGTQTLTILREIGEMYSLFVVGKGGGDSPMTMGMRDWEECPELGTVGDFLASSDLDVNASVLVVQRHRHSHNKFFYD